jgi:hypothetical protein
VTAADAFASAPRDERGAEVVRMTGRIVLPETSALTLALSKDVDLNGDGDVDSILDLVRGPSSGPDPR